MTTVASAPQHGVLLRSMFYACADAIQGPAEPTAAAELARRVLRHIAMTIDELVNGHEADTVAGHAQLAAEYANTLAHTALPAAGLDEASAATIRATLTLVKQQIRVRYAEWHGLSADHVEALHDQVAAAGQLLEAVVRWGGDSDSGRAAVRYAVDAAQRLQAVVSVLGDGAAVAAAR